MNPVRRGNATGLRTSGGWTLVARFTLAGAVVGSLAGLVEAAFLYSVPRFPGLLYPETRYVIWFLAPLAGMSLFGALGFTLGIAGSWKHISPMIASTFAAVGTGVAALYLAGALNLIHGQGKGLRGALSQPASWFAWVLAFSCTLLALKWTWRLTGRFFDKETPFPLRSLVVPVLLAILVGVSGVVFYLLTPLVAPNTMQANALEATHRPNIVLISLDTVRADHLSPYGYTRPTTPNLDRLAGKGVLFENAVAPTSWTLASHASILTELLPHQHGANLYSPVDTGFATLAEVLKSHGYETAGFSSNFLYGLSGWGMSKGFGVYADDSSSLRYNLAGTLMGRMIAQPLYELLVEDDAFYRRDARQVNRGVYGWFEHRSGRPFFLFINYYDAHDPYLVPPPYNAKFGQISDPLVRRVSLGIQNSGRLPEPLSSKEQNAVIAGYDNCLAYLDNQVGELLRFIAATPQGSNTVIIITADHGEAFGEHGRYSHAWNLYREVVHVPLIVVGPGLPAGLRVRHLVRTRELFSTVLDLALGARLRLRRTSLNRFWNPGFQPDRFDDFVVSELVPPTPDFKPVTISLMTSEWHYIQDSRGHLELYNWARDALEENDLSDLPQYQSTIETLRKRLQEYVGTSVRPWRGPDYLSALDRPGYSFLRETAFGLKLQANLPPTELRVGGSQAYFFSSYYLGPVHPQPADEELIKSLPYH